MENVCRQTFEQALCSTLGNSRLSCIVDGDECFEYWQDAVYEDIGSIQNLMDIFCEDISKIISHKIIRISRVDRTFILYTRGTAEENAKFAFEMLNRNIKYFINGIFRNLRHQTTAPINAIEWEKTNVETKILVSNDIQKIKLREPEKRCCNIEPNHIQKILNLCEKTHFDYQPYVLEDEHNKILALKFGCNWADFAIEQWKKPKINRSKIGTIFCLSWIFFELMPPYSLISIIFAILFGILTGGFIYSLYKKKKTLTL